MKTVVSGQCSVVREKTCFAYGCAERIKRGYLMCERHWFRVPSHLRDQVYLTLTDMRLGKGARGHTLAAHRARLAVAEWEHADKDVLDSMRAEIAYMEGVHTRVETAHG